MKKAIVASMLGIAGSLAMAASAQAAGYIWFENYDSATGLNAPVTFNESGLTITGGVTPSVAGNGVGSEFKADLLYSLDGGSTYTLLTFANSGASFSGIGGYPTPFGYGSTTDGPVPSVGSVYSSANPAGYFFGSNVEIPGYTSGPIWFIVEAYNGTSFADSIGVGLYRGESAPFEISSLAAGPQPPATFGPALQGFMVGPLTPPLDSPEPATLALGGLGMAALMLFCRKRA